VTDQPKADARQSGESLAASKDKAGAPKKSKKPKISKKPTKSEKKAKPTSQLFATLQAEQIAERLRAHIMGEIDMSASQVNAALTLLKQMMQSAPVDEVATPEREASVRHEDVLALLSQLEREE
jgi:ribosomal protein L9